jgi:hypothetical protein
MLPRVNAAAAVSLPNPGPMARLEEVKRDAATMNVIVQRVAGGETLRGIAKAWEVPHGPLLVWLMDDDERWAIYRRALVLGGFAEADEAKEILDASTPEQITVDKERAGIRRWRASKIATEFFGERLDLAVHRALPSEDALMAQLDALIAGRPGLLDQLLERRARLALPVSEAPAGPASTQGA